MVVSTYDLDGEKVGSKEYTVPGNELHVDTRVIKLSNGEHLFFPYGLYSDSMAMKDAFPIYDIYDKDGYPAIYSNLEGHSKEDLDKNSVIAIYTEVKDYFKIRKIYFEGEPIVAEPYKIKELNSGRYALFKGEEFLRIIEFPDDLVVKKLALDEDHDLFEKGGITGIIDLVSDGWSVKEISEFWDVSYNRLISFIKRRTGCNSIKSFQRKYSNGHLGILGE